MIVVRNMFVLIKIDVELDNQEVGHLIELVSILTPKHVLEPSIESEIPNWSFKKVIGYPQAFRGNFVF